MGNIKRVIYIPDRKLLSMDTKCRLLTVKYRQIQANQLLFCSLESYPSLVELGRFGVACIWRWLFFHEDEHLVIMRQFFQSLYFANLVKAAIQAATRIPFEYFLKDFCYGDEFKI